MAKHAAWVDDQVIDERSNGINFWGAYENTERIVFDRDLSGASACLNKVHLASPAGHDYVRGVTTRTSEAQPLPERNCGRKIVAWNYGKSAYGLWNGHEFFSCGGVASGFCLGYKITETFVADLTPDLSRLAWQSQQQGMFLLQCCW